MRRRNARARNSDECGPRGREHELALDYHDHHAEPAGLRRSVHLSWPRRACAAARGGRDHGRDDHRRQRRRTRQRWRGRGVRRSHHRGRSAVVGVGAGRRDRDRCPRQVHRARPDRHQRAPVAVRRHRRTLRDDRQVPPAAARDRARSGAAAAEATASPPCATATACSCRSWRCAIRSPRAPPSALASSPPATSSAGAVPIRSASA